MTVLPAEPDGPPTGLLVGYGLVLLLAAADGARRGYRPAATGLPVRPVLAAVLGLVLLAVPAGGAVAYGQARDEAREQQLLDRLEKVDAGVARADGKQFSSVEPQYRKALDGYRELAGEHGGSRAAGLVPDRLKAYYKSVAAPYHAKEYCAAVEPLTYLRTVPKRLDRELLGKLAGWPDGPLATSLLECGLQSLDDASAPAGEASDGELAELLRLFPDSDQAGRVVPAVGKEISAREKAVGGAEPCTATEQLRHLRTTAAGLPDGAGDALAEDAGDAVRDGVYACGVDRFEDKDFAGALKTLGEFRRTYKDDKRRARAGTIAIAAEIAKDRASAGKRLPPSRAPGGARMEYVITNDAPTSVEILYTGPVTGVVKLAACGDCKKYPSRASGSSAACKSGKKYDRSTLRLPAGSYHFLYKRGAGTVEAVGNHTSGARIQSGYTYTDCTYVIEGAGLPGGLELPSSAR
ncbi:hypothetical protein [Streptomyces triticagri]|uniref:hypothetical protein n=1 Tax=Streptomyces triticagri TaxID=2293568 RepID=UPI001F416EED|nr:hypothetical protein [Streptomyces triticagri]